VNSVRTIADKTKNSDVKVQMKFQDVKRVADRSRGAADDNEKRATEIGPVLEEILHSHWNPWGLND